MTPDEHLNDYEKLLKASRLLGIDSAGLPSDQLLIECWKTIALNNADQVDHLRKTVNQYKAMVGRYESMVANLIPLLDQRSGDSSQLLEQFKAFIRQTTMPRDN